jgi:hypothetical protein
MKNINESVHEKVIDEPPERQAAAEAQIPN